MFVEAIIKINGFVCCNGWRKAGRRFVIGGKKWSTVQNDHKFERLVKEHKIV